MSGVLKDFVSLDFLTYNHKGEEQVDMRREGWAYIGHLWARVPLCPALGEKTASWALVDAGGTVTGQYPWTLYSANWRRHGVRSALHRGYRRSGYCVKLLNPKGHRGKRGTGQDSAEPPLPPAWFSPAF